MIVGFGTFCNEYVVHPFEHYIRFPEILFEFECMPNIFVFVKIIYFFIQISNFTTLVTNKKSITQFKHLNSSEEDPPDFPFTLHFLIMTQIAKVGASNILTEIF